MSHGFTKSVLHKFRVGMKRDLVRKPGVFCFQADPAAAESKMPPDKLRWHLLKNAAEDGTFSIKPDIIRLFLFLTPFLTHKSPK